MYSEETTLSKNLVEEIIEELECFAEVLEVDGYTAYSLEILDLVRRIKEQTQ